MAPDRKSWMELRGQTQIWLERLTIDNQKQFLGTGNIKWEKYILPQVSGGAKKERQK